MLTILNGSRIWKFTSIVRQDIWKQFTKQFISKDFIKAIKHINNWLWRIGLSYKSEHQAGFHEVYCKKAFSTFYTHHWIHLYFCKIRILLLKFEILLIITTNTTAFVYFEFWFFVSFSKLYFSWKIDIPNIKEACINVVIDSFLTTHQFIFMFNIDLMNWLTIVNQRSNDCI